MLVRSSEADWMFTPLLASFLLPSAPLASHLDEQGIEFMQFAFRWMNCLLMREMNMACTIRMWDTYLVRPHLHLSFLPSFCFQRVFADLSLSLSLSFSFSVSYSQGRRDRRLLPISSLRVLGFPRQVE